MGDHICSILLVRKFLLSHLHPLGFNSEFVLRGAREYLVSTHWRITLIFLSKCVNQTVHLPTPRQPHPSPAFLPADSALCPLPFISGSLFTSCHQCLGIYYRRFAFRNCFNSMSAQKLKLKVALVSLG